LPYAGPREFASSCASVVRDGLADDNRLIVLAASRRIDDVRDHLGGDGDDVTFVATDQHGRNPGRITTLLHSFQSAGDGRHSVGVNEMVLLGRSPAAQVEARFSDQVLNDASLRSWPLSVVCLYDNATLDDDGRHSMRQSHAVVRGSASNDDFAPDLAASLYATPVEAPPARALRLEVDRLELSELRAFVRDYALAHRVDVDRIDDLVLAANEIVTNSLRYGGGHAWIAMWTADGSLVCEVRDRGFIRDPLAGRFAPPPSASSGRGLWLANHLCDLVQLRSSEAGTVVRMYVDQRR
jgi:anti-sigma regulatory factor (Ser/Thr protein kinase)